MRITFPSIKRPPPYFPSSFVCLLCSVVIFTFLDFPPKCYFYERLTLKGCSFHSTSQTRSIHPASDYFDITAVISRNISQYLSFTSNPLFKQLTRSGREGFANTLAHAHTRNDKNTPAVWRTHDISHIVFAHLFMIHSFLTVLITLFTIAFIRCSVLLYSTFYLLFFFPIFIFSFSCTCYLLNTVKASVYEALRSLSFYMKTEATKLLLHFRLCLTHKIITFP